MAYMCKSATAELCLGLDEQARSSRGIARSTGPGYLVVNLCPV